MTIRKKTAQHKAFFSKWFYIIMGIGIGYIVSVKFPAHETLTFLKDVEEYVSGSALLLLLVSTFATSYLTIFFKKRAEDR